MTVKEVENIVANMSPAELAEFAEWFDRFQEEQWDQQIANDARSGKLDQAMRAADEAFKTGRVKPL